ncbi:sigma-54-dependent transcriptional regulator [Vulgatibacter incomptus]|uniref:Response regulator of zinc sigma-54-dependent two-component system n=1 Tax=Vulgatibacter incomptus TaxID=1391653 RepID=A0A0K1P9D3_9BACT|nr:sigma-54 dependent transcriptional regulator [Vulgatibacter incomptus]AKU90122.1 Response regulator of zinc sigma-54-dependent two-component system [Vulgatibacter incomptus]
MSASILVIDDERTFRMLAGEALGAEGFEVEGVGNLAQARAILARSTPDVILLDRRLPDGDGLDLLRGLPPDGPQAIVITAYGDVENAVEALHAGARDYLTKPVQLADLVVKLRKVLETRGLRDRLELAKTSAAGPPLVPPTSPAMREVFDRLEIVAGSPHTPVFLLGPSGVGKQYAAEYLHSCGPGPDAPFVDVNCAALPDELVESELFGHEKGAFTDARNTRRGMIELANGGTLFLDEITTLPLRSQAKLLKFLDSMRFRRVGGEREIEVRLRVVAATNQDVAELVRTGAFREDLFHRLTVYQVHIPALAHRREDLPELARVFAKHFATKLKKPIDGLSGGALAALERYPFPGNVRELRNVIERAVILAPGREIGVRELLLPNTAVPTGVAAPYFTISLDSTGDLHPLIEVERRYVGWVLERSGGRRMNAASSLGISYPTFLKRLRELGLD